MLALCQRESFTVVIRLFSTRLMKPNFHVSLAHRRNTTVSLETRNLFILETVNTNITFFGCSPEPPPPKKKKKKKSRRLSNTIANRVPVMSGEKATVLPVVL